MTITKALVTGLLIVAPLTLPAQDRPIRDLEQLLDESGLELVIGEEFVDVPIDPSALVQYEKAYRTEDGALEVRYMVRPLNRIIIDYEDPHSAVPEPNHMFNMLFHTLVGDLTQRGSRSPTRDYSTQMAREQFNADWASMAAFDVVPEFSSDYRQVLMVAIHRNDMADAYTLFLYNDYEKVKERLNGAMASLRFRSTGEKDVK